MSEIEKALLGSFIMDNSLLPSDLEEGLFADERNKTIVKKMKEMRKRGEPFDLPILADKLNGKASPTYLAGLFDHLTHVNPDFLRQDNNKYLLHLREEKIKRQLKQMLEGPLCDFEELKRTVLDYVPELNDETGQIQEGLEEYIQLSKNKEQGLRLGFPGLDRVIGGLRYGELFLVMGRTTTGKTWVLLNVLRNLTLKAEENIGFFSLEMPKSSILERLIQLNLSLAREEVFENVESLDKQTDGLLAGYKNVRIYEQLYSIEDMRSKIRSDSLKVLLVDSLGLLKCERFNNPYQQTTHLITQLKALAKDENVLIIVAHQLSREAEDGAVPVKLHMARDSGAVEEMSDFIIGIWRPEIGSDKEEAKNKIYLHLIKNKRGETRMIDCDFNKKTGLIREIDGRKQ